jgi:hypothetical protein
MVDRWRLSRWRIGQTITSSAQALVSGLSCDPPDQPLAPDPEPAVVLERAVILG